MKRDLAICVVLVAAVCLAHGHAVSFEFLDYDDNYYVTHNRDVAGGLTADGVVAALARSYTSSWFPLAIISHQLDVQLFALRPAGHHLTNVLLHLVNVLLLFALLKQMTAAGWRSAAVAALFFTNCHAVDLQEAFVEVGQHELLLHNTVFLPQPFNQLVGLVDAYGLHYSFSFWVVGQLKQFAEGGIGKLDDPLVVGDQHALGHVGKHVGHAQRIGQPGRFGCLSKCERVIASTPP